MKRIVLQEGSLSSQTISSLALDIGVSALDLQNGLNAAENYLCKRLSLSGIIHIERDRFSFSRIAGVFPVANSLEIEIVPKFMSQNDSWRADFLLLLARTRWGILAERMMVGSSVCRERGLSDSLAIVYLSMFSAVSHVPIREYRRRIIEQFEIEGDLDEETLLIPETAGFKQEITEFSKRNKYNSVLSEAAKVLLGSVSDFSLQSRLSAAVTQYGKQDSLPAKLPNTVPSRFRAWDDLYGLSKDILDGFGIDYVNQGDVLSPGFVVRTSDAWEEFLRRSLVSGLSECKVAFQEKHPFAHRDESLMKVRPDYTISDPCGKRLLIDAKYKYKDASSRTISNADIYEGFAFIEATGIKQLVLLYPFIGSSNTSNYFEIFQRIERQGKEIIGVRVNPRLAAEEDISSFSNELACFVRNSFLA